jgi:hypothetical protein
MLSQIHGFEIIYRNEYSKKNQENHQCKKILSKRELVVLIRIYNHCFVDFIKRNHSKKRTEQTYVTGGQLRAERKNRRPKSHQTKQVLIQKVIEPKVNFGGGVRRQEIGN